MNTIAWVKPKPVWFAVKLMLGVFCRPRPGLVQYENRRYAIPGSLQSAAIDAALAKSMRIVK